MHAQLVRPDRYGEPAAAIQDEVIDVPELGPHDALVMVMAAGVNYNNVWAARGVPVDVTKTPGAVGRADRLPHRGLGRLGRRVRDRRPGHERRGRRPRRRARRPMGRGRSVGEGGQGPRSRRVRSGSGATTPAGVRSRSSRKVQAHQCLPKADFLTWEEAAAPTLTGSTAYRMLFGWPPHTVEPGDVVLVWGASGGLGSLAVQMVANAGGRAVAVVGSDEKGEYAKSLGRGRVHQPEAVLALGRAAGMGQPRVEGLVRGREGVRQGGVGRAGGEDLTADRVRASRPGHDPHVDLRRRPRAAWS